MEQPRNISLFPQISYARVVGYDWNNHGVYVDLPSQQQVSTLAKVLMTGTGDASRIDQLPLPVIGSWGLVVGAFGDTTSLIWLGCFYMSAVNAVNNSSPPVLEDSEMKYMSHASGTYSLLDYYGNYFWRSPDGTMFLLNPTNQQPTTYRHIVDSETGTQQQIVFADTDRNPNPPEPFYVAVKHPTGTTAMITPTGIIHLDTGGQVEQASQGPIFELNPLSSGTTAPSGTPAGGAQLIGQAGLSSVYLDKDGNITITSTGSSTQILVSANGDVTINSLDGDVNVNASSGNVNIDAALDILLTTNLLPGVPGIMSVNDLITKYNQHNHFVENVQTGSSQVETTGPENVWKLP